jgi:hypothetical protein
LILRIRKNVFFLHILFLELAHRHFIYSPKNLSFCIYEKREVSGSVTLANGSGSGKPKNMRILRFRIRIPNKAHKGKTKQQDRKEEEKNKGSLTFSPQMSISSFKGVNSMD